MSNFDLLFADHGDTDFINVTPASKRGREFLFGSADALAASADFYFKDAKVVYANATKAGLACELPPSLDAEFCALDEEAQPAWSPEVMKVAFERVQNPAHWKGAIDCVIEEYDDRELEKIKAAVFFYTATAATIEKIGKGQFRVTAPGYWAGPAN